MAGGLSVSDAKQVIDTIVSTLENNTERRRFGGIMASLKINEVLKGGSMGKGTMIQGDFDVDLVIYTTSIDLHSAARIRGYGDYFRAIHSYLSTKLSGYYTLKDCNNLSLQFTCYGVKVDILLSPYFRSYGEYCSFLEAIDRTQLSLFSCSAARWQIDFVQSYPDKVIDYIKKVKAWRNAMWDDQGRKDGRPKSYLIELLVIKAYEDCLQNSQQISSITRIVGATPLRTTVSDSALRQQLIRLVTDQRIAIYWTHYYTEDKIWRFNDRQPPFIIDPANPSNNVYRSGIVKQGYGSSWETFRSMIYTLQF